MANKFTYRNITFDDFTHSEHGAWSQICKDCLEKYGSHEIKLDEVGSGTCGVNGCSNEAEYYIDFGLTIECLYNRAKTHRGVYSDVGVILENYSTEDLFALAQKHLSDSPIRYYLEQQITHFIINEENQKGVQYE